LANGQAKIELVSVWLQPEPQNWWQVVEDALAEDLGSGDVSGGVIAPDDMALWYVEAQQEGVLCGVGILEYLLGPNQADPDSARITVETNDGQHVARGQVIARGALPARRALSCERTALNFVMQLSGVATLTREFVRRVEGTGAKIVDTRKTTPLLRGLQKYAVRCGGGHNHRMGLFDGAMLKDNHIRAAGSIRAAVEQFRAYASHMTKLEIECETLEQVDEAVEAGADVVLLDNMNPFDMREAVKKHTGKVLLEASGGIHLDTVKAVGATGVDIISVGALTHSAPAIAFHMEFE
jgi:nicotinate-nucleotide pyrophosphorylase (carboxylating)